MFSDKQRECFIKLCVHVYYTINTSQKAYGCDDLSINMIKICDIEIVKSLYLTYMKCLKTGRFPSSWKKANVLPIHNKESRQLKKNYVPISLLLICWKIFEKLIFDTTYKYLYENQLLTLSQSGFRPGNRQQRVVLNEKNSNWSPVTAGVPQGSVLGPLFYLIYINNLVDNVNSEAKLFADDKSLFTVVYDVDISADKLNRDLYIISN